MPPRLLLTAAILGIFLCPPSTRSQPAEEKKGPPLPAQIGDGLPPSFPPSLPRVLPPPRPHGLKSALPATPVSRLAPRPGKPSTATLSRTTPEVNHVNALTFDLAYQVENIGPSKLRGIDVWWTHDGRQWQRHTQEVQPTGAVPMKVGGEGRYGFTLIPRSGAGLAGHPPVPGDSPQTWVEVDLTPPAVQIHGELIGVSGRRVVQVKWQARDRNLAPDPVTILCAEKPDGPWKELSRELAPTGSREFEAEELPRAFYLRVEATDRAGNVGAYTTPDRVEADLTIPIIRKVTVKPTPAR